MVGIDGATYSLALYLLGSGTEGALKRDGFPLRDSPFVWFLTAGFSIVNGVFVCTCSTILYRTLDLFGYHAGCSVRQLLPPYQTAGTWNRAANNDYPLAQNERTI
jgi:hypothetical protein